MGKNFKFQNELSKEINLIASDPDEHYAIEASSYLALTKIKDVVKDCICMGMSQDCVSKQAVTLVQDFVTGRFSNVGDIFMLMTL